MFKLDPPLDPQQILFWITNQQTALHLIKQELEDILWCQTNGLPPDPPPKLTEEEILDHMCSVTLKCLKEIPFRILKGGTLLNPDIIHKEFLEDIDEHSLELRSLVQQGNITLL